jgi:oxalate---CoA ligase
VLKPETEALDARSLLNFAEKRLAPFKLPRRIFFVSEIPKGPTGKPQRVGLAKHLGLEEEGAPNTASDPMAVTHSPTELALLRLCRQAFKLETIGIHDDFFERGGDSLSAQIFLLEIERHWNVTVTIADMFAAPTIAQFAKVIDEAAPTRQAPQLAVIQIGGSRHPFFFLHAGPRFRDLARLLGPEQPFFGPVQPHPSKLPRRCRIEDVAAQHIEIIRNAQPRGPYFVGGWCVDGLVAYEIAQQLRALGEPVGLLVLFDTSFYSSRFVVIYERVRARVERVVGLLRWMRQLRCNEIANILKARLRRLGQRMQGRFDRHWRGEPEKWGGWTETAVQHRASEWYRPLPYHGRVLLLQRSLQQSRWTRARQDWRRLVRGEFEAYDIPGDHLGMFERPYVVVTGKKLRASLRDAQATPRGKVGASVVDGETLHQLTV